MKYNKETDMEYRIVRRPITHYVVSVFSRERTSAGMQKARQMITYPISADYCGDRSLADHRNVGEGEKIIACVPPVPGAMQVFVEFTTSDHYTHDEPLGVDVPGMSPTNWDRRAYKVMRAHADTERIESAL